MRKINQDYVRSIIFGFEDSLVSSTGVIAGVSAGIGDQKTIVLAATVTIIVEALSMGAGQYLSERTVHQMDKNHSDSLFYGAVLMFFSYFVAGSVPLIPILFLPAPFSIYVGVASAFLALFILGFTKGKLVNISPIKSGLEVLAIGGLATILGIAAGFLLKSF